MSGNSGLFQIYIVEVREECQGSSLTWCATTIQNLSHDNRAVPFMCHCDVDAVLLEVPRPFKYSLWRSSVL